MCRPPSAAGFRRRRAAFPGSARGSSRATCSAYVTPPIQAIDVSDMRQRQGELDQQISIVERRYARYEQLAPERRGIARTQLEDTKLELEGLRERRAALDKSRREPEALIAPVAGVIAEGTPVAGQIAQPNCGRLPHRRSRAAVGRGAELRGASNRRKARGPRPIRAGTTTSSIRGAGFADRSQSIPVHFAIDGDTAGLRAGQFVTVLVATDETEQGLAVPRSSVVRGSNGQDFVFEHVTRRALRAAAACASSRSTASAC